MQIANIVAKYNPAVTRSVAGQSPSVFDLKTKPGQQAAYTATSAVSNGNLRDNILNNISQARITASPSFNAAPAGAVKEQFSIRDHYSLPPEDVKAILNQLQEEIRSADFSGMSNLEIYEFIEGKFIDAFGEDFMMGHNLLGVVPNSDMFNNPDRVMSNYEYVEIGNSFNDLVGGKVGFGEMHKINRERLYGSKNDSEIIDDIIAKYPQRLTNRHLALIASEIRSVGISDNIGFGRYVDDLFEKSGDRPMSQWVDFEDRWNGMLNQTANVQQMAFLHNGSLIEARSNPFALKSALQTKDILVKLGAILGPDGLFLDPEGESFVKLDAEIGGPNDLIDEFLEDVDKHDKRLRESRERLEKDKDLEDVKSTFSENKAD